MSTPFVRNNIRYRSAASKALEGYYNSKAFILNELVTRENGFGESAKEILLLLFNRHAEWLFHTEALLLNKSNVSESDVHNMQQDLKSTTIDVFSTLDEHPEVFDVQYVKHWRHIHEQKLTVLLDMFTDIRGMTQIIAFPYATECLVEYLNSTLFELYELDCLLGSDLVESKLSTNRSAAQKLVLHIDDLSIAWSEKNGKQAEMERVLYYENLFCERKTDIVIRDYIVRANSNKTRNQILSELRDMLATRSWADSITVVNPHADKDIL